MVRERASDADANPKGPDRAPVPAAPSTAAATTPDLLHQLPPAQAHDLLVQFGATHGNQGVQGLVVQRYAPHPAASLDAEDAADSRALMNKSAGASTAEAIWTLVSNWGEPTAEDAVQVEELLSGTSRGVIQAVKSEFAAAHGVALEDFIVSEMLSFDASDSVTTAGIKALAILDAGHTHDLHVAVALAVIPVLTRDAELTRIQTAVAGRGKSALVRLQDDYNRVFARAHRGSLDADLRGDLSGADLQRALALVDHQLTGAEELYLDSVAVTGTEVTKVVNRIQAAWDAGPDAFWELEHDWNRWVRGENGWMGGPWTNLSMRAAIEGELHDAGSSGADWYLVRPIFESWERHQAGLPPVQYDDFFAESEDPFAPLPANEAARQAFLAAEPALQNQLLAVQMTLQVVANSEDAAQIERASKELARLHQQRMTLADATGDPALIERVSKDWDADKVHLLAALGQQFDTDDVEYMRARLLVQGNLNLADELWLVLTDPAKDNAKILAFVVSTWAKGENAVDELCEQAAVPWYAPRAEGDATTGQAPPLRPAIPIRSAGANSGLFGQMFDASLEAVEGVAPLLTKDATDRYRGAAYLWWQIKDQENPEGAYKLLSAQGLSPERRGAVVEKYVEWLPQSPLFDSLFAAMGMGPAEKFVGSVLAAFPGHKASLDLQDLLCPAKTIDQIVARAEDRAALEESTAVEVGGSFTGEDSGQVSRESLARLQFIRDQGTDPAELEALMTTLGAKSPLDLAGVEYGMLKERLAEMRELRAAMADGLATLAETLVTVFAPIIIPGGGLVLAMALAAGSSATGMVVKNAVMGDEYVLLSKENAAALAKAAGGAAAAKLGGAAKAAERLKKYSPLVQDVAAKGVEEVTVMVGTIVYNQKLPAGSDLIAMGARAGSAGVGTWIKGADPATLDRSMIVLRANVASGVMSEVTDEFNAWATGGTGDLTPWDMAERLLIKVSVASSKATVTTIGEVTGAEQAAAKERARRAEIEKQAEAQQEKLGPAYENARTEEERAAYDRWMVEQFEQADRARQAEIEVEQQAEQERQAAIAEIEAILQRVQESVGRLDG